MRPLAERRPDVRVAIVRTGIVLARQGGALAKMLPMFRESAAGRLGSGRQWMSWIHIDDIVRLFLHALDSQATGVLEGVAPQPVTNREFTKSLCRSLRVLENAPAPVAGDQGALRRDGRNRAGEREDRAAPRRLPRASASDSSPSTRPSPTS